MHPHKQTQNKRKLRLAARDRDCQIRIPGICNGDNSTVVLCHLPGAGMARKSDDFLDAAWGCHDCHAALDGRIKTEWPKELLSLWHYHAINRTQKILISEGVVHVKY